MRGAIVVQATAAVLVSVAVSSGLVHLVRFTEADKGPSAVVNDLRARQPDSKALRFLVTANSLNPEERTLSATVVFVSNGKDPAFVDTQHRPLSTPRPGSYDPSSRMRP